MGLWGDIYPVKRLDLNQDNIQLYNQAFHISKYDHTVIEKFYHEALINEIDHILNQNHQLLSQYFDLDRLIIKTQLMKSRLGSCQVKKRVIKLNTILARIDKKYTKLVLYHELTHLVYPNHSKKFHELLEKLYPYHRETNRKLTQIIRQFTMTDWTMKA